MFALIAMAVYKIQSSSISSTTEYGNSTSKTTIFLIFKRILFFLWIGKSRLRCALLSTLILYQSAGKTMHCAQTWESDLSHMEKILHHWCIP